MKKKSPCILPLSSRTNLLKQTANFKKASEFKIKLLERVKFKRNFLVSERQMKHILKDSRAKTTSHLFTRLDMVVYSMIISNENFWTLAQIRQKIRHGQVFVNGVREKRPNFECQSLDQIYIKGGQNLSGQTRPMNQAYSLDFSNLKA